MSDNASASSQWLEYPRANKRDGAETRAGKLVDWVKNNLHYTSLYRLRRWALWRVADLFFDGNQNGVMPEDLGFAGYDLSQLFSPDALYFGADLPARPVLNEFKDAVLNEAARLDKSDYEPTVRVSGKNPTYKQRKGARAATKVLRSTLKACGWEHKKRMIASHLPLYGGAWIISRWETSMEKTVRVPREGCSCCPQCGEKFGPMPAPAISGGTFQAEMGLGACPMCDSYTEQRDPSPDEMAARMASMPLAPPTIDGSAPAEASDEHQQQMMAAAQEPITETFPGGPQLQPYQPADGELLERDALGNEFGEDVPLGEGAIDIPWPGDMWEADFGVNAAGEPEVRDVTVTRVRNLDTLRAKYKNARSAKLTPENPIALTNHHPVGGELEQSGDRHIWRNAAREITRIRMPWMEPEINPETGDEIVDQDGNKSYKLNRGVIATVAHGLPLQDEDLMLEGPDGKLFPRVLVLYVPHDLTDGGQQRQGSSLSKTMFDAQRGINFSAAMDGDEQRMGASRYMVNAATDLSFEQAEGTALQVVKWGAPDNSAAELQAYKPELISRPTADHKWGAQSEFFRSFIDRASRKTEVESGIIPGPTTPAQAMQIAREESGEVRRPRVEALAEAYERLFTHQLQLAQYHVHEPRVARDPDGDKEQDLEWRGVDFAGQTEVEIDIASAADSEVLAQAKLSEAIKDGLVPMSDPRVLRIIGKERGVPVEIYDLEDQQDAVAEREFQEFTHDLDPGSDPMSMQFGPGPTVDEGLDDDAAHAYQHRRDMHSDLWRQLEVAADWDAAIRAIYPWKDVMSWMLSSPGATPNTMLTPCPEDWIFGLWQQLLSHQGPLWELYVFLQQQRGQEPVVIEVPTTAALLGVLRFRAHLAAHELRLKMATMQPAAPAPGPVPEADPAQQVQA